MPSPVGKKAGLFRQQLILQSEHRGRLQQAGQTLVELLDREPASRKVRWQVDVDPLDFS